MRINIMITLATLFLLGACQSTTNELSNEDKKAIVEEVGKANTNLFAAFTETYDEDTPDKILEYYSENMDERWQGEPVAFAFETEVMSDTYENFEKVIRSITSSRITTQIDIKENYYSVLSADMVLHYITFDGTMVSKDSTSYGPFHYSNTFIWVLEDGAWKVSYGHQDMKEN